MSLTRELFIDKSSPTLLWAECCEWDAKDVLVVDEAASTPLHAILAAVEAR